MDTIKKEYDITIKNEIENDNIDGNLPEKPTNFIKLEINDVCEENYSNIQIDPVFVDCKKEETSDNESMDCVFDLQSREGEKISKKKVSLCRTMKQKSIYSCEICSKKCKSPCDLETHHRVHSGIKPFTCKECGKSFSQVQNLKTHCLIHNGERTFICSECPKSFHSSHRLKDHTKVHSIEKRFQCKICEIKFKRGGELTAHLRIHSGEKPYLCGLCDMSFSQSNGLRQHEQRHRQDYEFPCEICEMRFKGCGELKTHLRKTHDQVQDWPKVLLPKP